MLLPKKAAVHLVFVVGNLPINAFCRHYTRRVIGLHTVCNRVTQHV